MLARNKPAVGVVDNASSDPLHVGHNYGEIVFVEVLGHIAHDTIDHGVAFDDDKSDRVVPSVTAEVVIGKKPKENEVKISSISEYSVLFVNVTSHPFEGEPTSYIVVDDVINLVGKKAS